MNWEIENKTQNLSLRFQEFIRIHNAISSKTDVIMMWDAYVSLRTNFYLLAIIWKWTVTNDVCFAQSNVIDIQKSDIKFAQYEQKP